MSKSLIKQLKKLENISPDSGWRASERDLLLSKIDNTNILNNAKNINTWRNFYFSRLTFVAVRPAMAVLVMIVLVLSGSIATVSAAKGSLPGDALYPVKLAGEQVKLALAANEVDKAKVQLEIVGNRTNEIKKLVGKDSSTGKADNIKKTVENFKTSVSAIQEHINKASAEGTTEDLVVLVKEVNDKVKEYGDTLAESSIQLRDQESKEEAVLTEKSDKVAEAVNAAVASASFTSTDALRVLIYQENTGKVKINQEQIKQRTRKEIDNYKEQFSGIKQSEEELLNLFNSAVAELALLEESQTEAGEETPLAIKDIDTILSELEADIKEIDFKIKESGQLIVDRLLALHERGKYKNLIDDLLVYKNNLLNIEKYIKDTNESVKAVMVEIESLKTPPVVEGTLETPAEEHLGETAEGENQEVKETIGEEVIEVEKEIEN